MHFDFGARDILADEHRRDDAVGCHPREVMQRTEGSGDFLFVADVSEGVVKVRHAFATPTVRQGEVQGLGDVLVTGDGSHRHVG